MYIRADQLTTGMWLNLTRETDLTSDPDFRDALHRHVREHGRAIRINEVAAISSGTVSIDIDGDWMISVAADRELAAANVFLMVVKHPDGAYRDARVTIDYDYDDRDRIRYPAAGIAQFSYSAATDSGDTFDTGTFPALDTFAVWNDLLHRHAAAHVAGIANDPDAAVIAEILNRPTGITVADVRTYPIYLFDLHADRLGKTRCPHRYFLSDSCPGCDADQENADAA